MRWLKAAIAQVLTRWTRTRVRPTAQSTQIAGLVLREPTNPTGNDFSAPDMLRLSRAQAASSKKAAAAQSTSADRPAGKKKSPAAPTGESPKARGSKSKTTAPKTRRHAK